MAIIVLDLKAEVFPVGRETFLTLNPKPSVEY
jgi:hypothetical protein